MRRSWRVWMVVSAVPALLAGCGGNGASRASSAITRPIQAASALRFTELQTSQAHTCGVALDGRTYCWGGNSYGELGTAVALDTCDIPGIEVVSCTASPQQVAAGPLFAQMALAGGGARRSCAVDTTGQTWCWGFGLGGQLGDGSRTNSSVPLATIGEQRFVKLRASVWGLLTCGATGEGAVLCWGVNSRGLAGNGETSGGFSVPTAVDWGRIFVDFDLGEMHGCGITSDGQAWCWGDNWYGQLGVGLNGGNGGRSLSTVPMPVLGGHVFRAISTASDHSCALDESGAAWCWGSPNAVFTSTGPGSVGTPQPVPGGHRFVALRSGALHSCGLNDQGDAWCWGQNYEGELGSGSLDASTTPLRVDSPVRFARLAQRPTCALTDGGQAWCWGSNSYGQAGQRSVYAR